MLPKGYKFSELARRNMAAASKGKPKSELHKQHIQEARLGKKFSEASKLKMSNSHKGKIPWNKGMKYSQEMCKRISDAINRPEVAAKIRGDNSPSKRQDVKDKISRAHKGKVVSIETRKLLSDSHKGKTPTEETLKKMSAARKLRVGDKAPLWKGGISPLRKSIQHTEEYIRWKLSVFERDNYTCMICRVRGKSINAHHIKSFSKICEEYNIKTVEEALACSELWDINNGITYCEKCHKKYHKDLRESIVDL